MLFFRKIYTNGKNFTLLPAVTNLTSDIATNLNIATKYRMLGLKIFFWVQTLRRRPFAQLRPPCLSKLKFLAHSSLTVLTFLFGDWHSTRESPNRAFPAICEKKTDSWQMIWVILLAKIIYKKNLLLECWQRIEGNFLVGCWVAPKLKLMGVSRPDGRRWLLVMFVQT